MNNKEMLEDEIYAKIERQLQASLLAGEGIVEAILVVSQELYELRKEMHDVTSCK